MVGLRARRAYGRALRCVERTELNARPVDGLRHGASKSVDFLRQVALADTADGRVTAHLPERLNPVRHQQGARTRPRSSQRGFRSGVTAAYHYDVAIEHWLNFEQFGQWVRDFSRWPRALPQARHSPTCALLSRVVCPR
jgi:hypothetical protein